MSYLWDIKGKAPASYQSLCLMLIGCQGMGSWQERGCKFDFVFGLCVYVFQLKCESKMLVFLIQCSFNCISILICNLSSDFWQAVSYGVAAVTFSQYLFSSLLSIIAFNVWFQRLKLVQTAEAFWINNSCLALNKLPTFFFCASPWVKVIVYNTMFQNAPPFPSLFTLSLTRTSWYNLKTLFISFLMCYTHLCCLWIWLPFLVFNNVHIMTSWESKADL